MVDCPRPLFRPSSSKLDSHKAVNCLEDRPSPKRPRWTDFIDSIWTFILGPLNRMRIKTLPLNSAVHDFHRPLVPTAAA